MQDMSQIHYAGVAEALVEAVPELRARYEEELQWWGDEQPGPHVIFGDILNPYLIGLLDSDGHEEKLSGVFQFMERLANHQDIHIQELVAVTVCERLGDSPAHLKKAREFMGTRTRQLSKEVEDFWGRKP